MANTTKRKASKAKAPRKPYIVLKSEYVQRQPTRDQMRFKSLSDALGGACVEEPFLSIVKKALGQ